VPRASPSNSLGLVCVAETLFGTKRPGQSEGRCERENDGGGLNAVDGVVAVAVVVALTVILTVSVTVPSNMRRGLRLISKSSRSIRRPSYKLVRVEHITHLRSFTFATLTSMTVISPFDRCSESRFTIKSCRTEALGG